jgi:predicted amidohydrolase
MSAFRLGLCQYEITAPADFETYADKLDGLVAEGKTGGASLLLMPEYACMETAAFCPGAGNPGAELLAVCGLANQLLALFQHLAAKHRIWLVPGTLPWPDDRGQVRNRAPLIAPDGSTVFQDKRVMTRFEAERWGVSPGEPARVFETPWGCIGIAICYDVEFPTLVRAQVEQGAWLILAPSCTDSMHGFNRVSLSARARALENQCFVAVAPTVGFSPGLATLDENHGYAAVYGPVDRGFADDGIVAQGTLDRPSWLFTDLDPTRLDAVREDGAVRNFKDWPSKPTNPEAS